tara:strand:+ start:2679 stop:3329 length:651 start_codon:yes stop_codon:yes gene_type:complete
MKKILTVILSSLFLFSYSYAERGVNVGISGQLGVFHATGTETENAEITSDDATGVAGYASIFVEKELGPITIGLDYVPSALASETSETVRSDLGAAADGAKSDKTNKVQVDFEDLTTLYVALNTPLGVYVKAGLVQVDVVTNENLGTGSTYANTDMDGTMLGVGYSADIGDSAFLRIEGSYMDLGSASVTGSNTDNKIELKELEGATAKISIGKSF